MNLPPDPKADLQAAIRNGRAIIVSGTGVSIAASQGHPQASWTGLLESGLDLLSRHGLTDPKQIESHRHLLRGGPDTTQFIATAQAITSEMSPKMLGGWLKDTIGTIKAKNRQVLDVLDALRQLKNQLATTNYDGLLLEGSPALTPITWRDRAAVLGAYRDRGHDKVLFLHGYWEVPESVILDGRSYQEITRDQEYRRDLAAIWLTSTWLYVGCGESGLSDPDLGLLLAIYGKRARDDGHWDFLLAPDKDVVRLQSYFNRQEVNICVVSYGRKHDELGPFLKSLLPPRAVEPTVIAPASGASSAGSLATLPKPPAFYAFPDYIGRTTFIGRRAELKTLSEWAQPTDKTSVLLFEAIGGNGKSMLTWEWTTTHATTVRGNWAGRFWYSFYEKGAVMRQFCQHALAYMTQQPPDAFEKKSTPEMRVALLAELQRKSWLLILDGLERVLVAYHRIDAAEVRDEDLNPPTDKILDRNPCDAIRDDDTDLLRALAAAAPSKILVSSRLIPRALLNSAGLPLPGVRPLPLLGLEEEDAEALLRSGGVQGAFADIRYYLKTYCGNHPLLIGVLAGLINSPGPHRGNFDRWAADPAYGAKLNLARLDLVQSRNHILRAALDALEPASRQLLSTLALLRGAVDYQTVAAFNPHVPPAPPEVERPTPPERLRGWEHRTSSEKRRILTHYAAALAQWETHQAAVRAWGNSDELRAAETLLGKTIHDLESRGLLQYEHQTRRYDLHPVVRGVVADGMRPEDTELHGQRVVDHFAAQRHNPFERAESLSDLAAGVQVVRTLLKMKRLEEAYWAYSGDLAQALKFNLEAHAECLSILREYFPNGWSVPPREFEPRRQSFLANEAGLSLEALGKSREAIEAYSVALAIDTAASDWQNIRTGLTNIAHACVSLNRLAAGERLLRVALLLSEIRSEDAGLFVCRVDLFYRLGGTGKWQDAEALWALADPMGRNWPRYLYRPSYAERARAEVSFRRGVLTESELTHAERIARAGKNRASIRDLHELRGQWLLARGEWEAAAQSLREAVRMAREIGETNVRSETLLSLAKYRCGELCDPGKTADELAGASNVSHLDLGELYLAIGEAGKAKDHALAAYTRAWADGEPYVNRYALTKSAELLNALGVPLPNLPPYDPAKDVPFPWEADVRAAIEMLRGEKAAVK